jgi:hypothetical protein
MCRHFHFEPLELLPSAPSPMPSKDNRDAIDDRVAGGSNPTYGDMFVLSRSGAPRGLFYPRDIIGKV